MSATSVYRYEEESDQPRLEPWTSSPQQYIPHYPLTDLFPEGRLTDKLTLAEARIIETFYYATEIRRGRTVPTRGYIGDAGTRQKDLLRYVADRLEVERHGFVLASELPREFRNRQAVQVARQAEHDLLKAKLNQLCQQLDVWYNDHTTGYWEIKQSLMDKYRLDRHTAWLLHNADQGTRRERLHKGPLKESHNAKRLRVVN